jgi:hypothetical protein
MIQIVGTRSPNPRAQRLKIFGCMTLLRPLPPLLLLPPRRRLFLRHQARRNLEFDSHAALR